MRSSSTHAPVGGTRRTSRHHLVKTIAAAAVVLAAVACSASTTATAPGTSRGPAPAGSAAPPGTATGTSTAPRTAAAKAQSPGCGTAAPAPTLTPSTFVDRAITSSGSSRSYKVYVPASAASTSTPHPLIVDLHGYSEGNAVHTAMSAFPPLAEREGVIVVTPLGTGTVPWWNAVPSDAGPPDLQFIADVIDDAGRTSCIDPRRVFVTGLSNGAFMSSLIACRMADKVAAIAPVAGLRFPKDCSPGRPVPIVAFHGTDDQFVPYQGGQGSKVATLDFNEEVAAAFTDLTFAPIPDTLADWARAEGCTTPPSEQPVSATVTLTSYTGCRDGSVVELYTVQGGGHSWPGSEFSQTIGNVVGPTTMEINADDLMWAFFQQHPLPA